MDWGHFRRFEHHNLQLSTKPYPTTFYNIPYIRLWHEQLFSHFADAGACMHQIKQSRRITLFQNCKLQFIWQTKVVEGLWRVSTPGARCFDESMKVYAVSEMCPGHLCSRYFFIDEIFRCENSCRSPSLTFYVEIAIANVMKASRRLWMSYLETCRRAQSYAAHWANTLVERICRIVLPRAVEHI